MSEELELTTEEILKKYNALLDSVTAINSAVTTINAEGSDEDLQSILQTNLDHLTYMKRRPFWTTEDFTNVDTAIEAATAALD